MKRYWAIVGSTFVVPLVEVGPQVFDKIEGDRIYDLASVPVYFCRGRGVWPVPVSDCKVVTEVDPSEI